jgi:prolyl-tRNA editing enzyme YbaK/EbsC (Cys-tRNA(Pro) deacylase)
MHQKAQRVQSALTALGVASAVRELPDSTRTAAEAAAAIGTTVEQIAKSLVFVSAGRVILVIAAGPHRVSLTKVAAAHGSALEQPDAKTVKRLTGFSIGGVPPVGHDEQPVTYLDETLAGQDIIWAAAGTPNAVFPIRPADLIAITSAKVIDVRG